MLARLTEEEEVPDEGGGGDGWWPVARPQQHPTPSVWDLWFFFFSYVSQILLSTSKKSEVGDVSFSFEVVTMLLFHIPSRCFWFSRSLVEHLKGVWCCRWMEEHCTVIPRKWYDSGFFRLLRSMNVCMRVKKATAGYDWTLVWTPRGFSMEVAGK